MSYALYPEGGLPRLWRFVGDNVLPQDVLCVLHKDQNLLVINKTLYDRLTPEEQRRTLRTHSLKIYID